ncbi:MAG: WbqC family protein, partial [bacterium]|nr:WbqC family protein [bacterium]
MKVGIIQSNYIPWRGYFDFIDDVDVFIYYDDVHYSKNSWRNRNKIKNANGTSWVTVPVEFSLSSEKKNVEDIKISYRQNWQDKHVKSIGQAYSKTPFFSHYSEELFDMIGQKFEYLSELNVNINNWIMKQLGIDTIIRMSSEYNACGAKTERLIDLLKKVGAT